MAEELQETVERLQSRLLENLEPRKLVKTLKRLGELPITVDILVETGVGKTVNSFRKHDLAGGAAKDLVAKWKELVPQSADRSSKSHAKEATRSHAHSRGSEASYVRGHRLPRDPSPEEEHSCRVEEDDHVVEDDREQDGENDEMEEEERGYHTNYSPSPPQHQHYSPPRLAHGSGLRGGYQSEGYESPEPEPEPSPPPRKEARHHVKPHKEPSKNHHQHSSHGDHSKDKERLRDEDRRQRHAQTQSGDRGGGSGDGGKGEGKKRSADGEPQQSGAHKAAKHSRHSTQHDGKKERDKEEKERDKEEKERDKEEKKKGGSDGRPRVAPKDSPPLVKELVKEEDFDEFETPTMSFESFLTYDAPAVIKKKKKPSSSSSSSSSHCRPSHASSSSSSHHTRAPPPAASSSSSKSSSSKASKANGTKTSKKGESGSASAPPSEKRKRVVEAVQLPTLPDIPLPAIQPNYRPLPSLDITPLSPQRRKVPVSNDEEDAGFTGKRLSSKMSVYSGAKTTYLPKMMSLYEQCIRVLQNNVDSIDEVGGVPFEILEPVLDRCTPEQLYRIEQCNQSFIEESDELWRRHCQRDFKRAAPQEYESWRELYLRLHDEREERLRMLTQNIRSANENKPKGRQVKMAFVNSVAKAPRDVQRRQAKFGTASGSTASSTAASAPIKVRPVVMYSPLPSAQAPSSSSSQNSPPHSSSSAPTGGAGPGGHARSVAWDSKPQVKKIAPMMAKTIKAFKNRFSRR